MDKNIGKKLDGRYELLELIGVGGMADIYRARDIQEDRIVAVKILKTEFAGSDEFLRRFRNESKAIALLSHPNIVKIYDVGFTDKVQFIVMEYVDGITLTDYIEQQGVLKWRDAVYFTVQVLKALQHAHDRGIVHRDVKSSNIMLLRDGTIKVMDFGIARFNRENNKTMSEKTIGSVHYISPEQARGDITDERSDIYSVGVALYEMLTGKKPFDGDTPVAIALKHMQSTPKKPTEINETIPEGLEQIVLRAMRKEAFQRYQTAAEMINDLEEFKKNPGIIFDYKYNSVDGSAKYSEGANPEDEPVKERIDDESAPEQREIIDDDDDDDDDDEYEERRSPLIPILFGVGTAFIIATVFLIVILVSRDLGLNASDYVGVITGSSDNDISINNNDEFEMPLLIGMNYKDAQEKYGNVLNLKIEQQFSEYTKDEIFDQELPQGRTVKVGQEVTIYVSKGIKQVEIRDLSGRTADAAEAQLKKDGFIVTKTYEESDDVAENYVLRTIPPAHEMAPQGSTVTIVLSMGPKNSAVYVPKLTTLPLATALKRCEEYFLTAEVEYVDSEEEEGTVIDQSIAPNTITDRGTKITLYVSSGEIPEQTKTITVTIPSRASGKFRFEYYVDSVLDEDASETRDVGLASGKQIKYDVKGRAGDVVVVAINVTYVETGKSGTFIQVQVTFNENGATATELDRNSNVFTELAAGASVPTPPDSSSTPDTTTTTSATNPPDSSSEPESSTPESSDPESSDDSSDDSGSSDTAEPEDNG